MYPANLSFVQRIKLPARRRPEPEPIDCNTMADCCVMFALICATQPARIREFFEIKGDRHAKIAFLLKYGQFDLYKPKVQ